MKSRTVLLAIGAVLAAAPALACYTVYDAQNRVVYNAQVPPVDMSRPLHETIQRAYPGGHLVFGDSLECPGETYSRVFLQATSSGRSPLLTDQRTAVAMGVPHTVVGEGIAMIPHRPDNMRPGVVQIASQPSAARSDTRAMGAGAVAPPANRSGFAGQRTPKAYERSESPRR